MFVECIYRDLYNSVSYNRNDLEGIREDVESNIYHNGMNDECVISSNDGSNAILCLKPHKNDGSSELELSTNHFINARVELSVHISFLFSAIISHGAVPTDFITSTMPIPKVKPVSAVANDNFRGIAFRTELYVSSSRF